jgi:hypothetical protein
MGPFGMSGESEGRGPAGGREGQLVRTYGSKTILPRTWPVASLA